MVMMSPANATTNPAPAEGYMSRMLMRKPSGAARSAGLSLKEYWVFAMQIGVSPKPNSVSCFALRSAVAEKSTPSAP